MHVGMAAAVMYNMIVVLKPQCSSAIECPSGIQKPEFNLQRWGKKSKIIPKSAQSTLIPSVKKPPFAY